MDERTIGSLKLGKVFHDCSHHITSLEFDATGEYCLTGCPEDESIILYDALDGQYGVRLVTLIRVE